MPSTPGFIGGFSDDDVAWVVRNGVQRHVPAGHVLIEEGGPLDALYVVLEGSFRVSSEGLGVELLGRLGPGQIAGEMAYVRGLPPVATVRAEHAATVLEIPWSRLDAHIAADRDFAARFHRAVAEFTVQRLDDWRSRLFAPAAAGTPRQPPSSDRVEELIERMLRGDFPDRGRR